LSIISFLIVFKPSILTVFVSAPVGASPTSEESSICACVHLTSAIGLAVAVP